MPISTKTTKMLWGRAAGRCSICKLALVLDATATDDESLIGEMCHIAAESDDGPRGRSTLTSIERDLYGNLVLLCRNHHGEIDTQEFSYPVERLHQIKNDHESWVRNSLPDYNSEQQRDDEIYAGYIDEWALGCDLKGWTDWSSFVFGGGQPELSIKMDKSLEELRRWILRRVWPKRYPLLEKSLHNFRYVLQDFQNTFREHVKNHGDVLMTEKFYHIEEWNPERYHRLLKQFEFHVDLVQDLMCELTRAANLICDEVRATLLPSFWLAEGRLSVLSGPHLDLSWHENVVQYSQSERQADLPYPGLKQFLIDRETRDLHYGGAQSPAFGRAEG